MSSRNFLVALLCCASLAWFAGPEIRLFIIILLLLFAPGYLLEQIIPSCIPSMPFLRPALWMGLSISVVALIYEWATVIGIALSTRVLGILVMFCIVGIVWFVWKSHSIPQDFASRNDVLAHWGALLLVLALTLWTRFTQIHDLVLPVWVDPIHHSLMIRVTIEQGQVPYSLRPYLPVDNLPYHWGYHVFTAAVIQLSGMELTRTMLLEGQILNALVILPCAALATFLWRRPLAGIVAAIVVGVVSIMPSYYVSWGRYTHLTGLLLLPVIGMLWHSWLYKPSRNDLILTAVLLAGLCMIHFLVLILTLCLLAAMTIVWGIDHHDVSSRFRQTSMMAGLSLLLTAPWLWVLTTRFLFPTGSRPQEFVTGGDFSALHEGLLWAGQNRLLITLALLSMLWGFWQRSKAALSIFLWVSIMVLLANPWMIPYLLFSFGLLVTMWALQQRQWVWIVPGIVMLLINPWFVTIPYIWLITNDVICMSFFVTLGVLIGGGAEIFAIRLRHISHRTYRLIAQTTGILVLTAFALWGAWNIRHVVNPETILTTAADVKAIDWVAHHTPKDARFLINAAGWYPSSDRGTDGGYWLLSLAGRWITTPPMVFMYGKPDYAQHVRDVSNRIARFRRGQEQALFDLIRQEQITHIYLGPKPGPLSREIFQNMQQFETIYDQDGVVILAIREKT